MSPSTATDVSTIPPVNHDEAIELAETEYRRFVDLLRGLGPDDWGRPTDCDRWDVRAVALHVLGAMDANASMRELLHQQRLGGKAGKEIGGSSLDGVNEVQIRERSSLSGDELVRRYEATVERAVRGRRRFPRPLRGVKMTMPPPWTGKRSLGWLNDVVYTRDTWMHRVDLSRATSRDLVLTAEHDGRIVADVVGDWARLHGQPFELVLTGPAGGRFRTGTGGEHHELDAIEFCRSIAGRRERTGLLATEVPF
jgi:uncharacterized protein (TIGR03083 family)